MNMKEFAALKVGDKIENPMSGSTGEVAETTDSGIRVVWGWNNRPTPHTAPTFFYSVNSTAWMHWSKVVQHASSCALHNGPAYPAGPCDCGAG